MRWALLALLMLMIKSTALQSEPASYSFSWQAFAPNAGGQRAYILRRSTNHKEINLFYNEYLVAGSQAIMGGGYNWRFPICDNACFWQFFVQSGLGVSTGGPYVEFSWTTVPFWLARLDITTHLFITKSRLVTWSYPLWIGISLPLPF